MIGGFRCCHSAFWEPSSIKCCDSRWLRCSAGILPVSHTRAACQRPTEPGEHGRLYPRCDDTRSACSITNSSEGGRYRRGDQTHRPAALVTIWVDFFILSDHQRGSSLSPFFFLAGGGGVGGGQCVIKSRTRTGCLATRAGDCSATVGAASISPGSHYTETARKRGSETEMKIEEKMRGKGKIGRKKKRERSRRERHGGGTEGTVGDRTP